MNSLTAEASFVVGPIVLGTLVKHYLARVKKDAKKQPTQLRRDEMLYDQVFNIVKRFLEIATYHTVEEVQAFGNTPTPSPPWVHVVRVVVPMSCCDEAAKYITQALGGQDAARRLVGGVNWWQVRGINGVDGQWITAQKDWQEAKRRYKMQKAEQQETAEAESATYENDMDAMRCILYLHGGGYYFGSVDQERYSIQRHARKISGRAFAINYRLAPQYPFPCALQDALAAYLYLLNPPPDAKHRPVKPAHLVIAGDSAGGGLSLALLQVIRDLELPQPAGGVLISPWCDLTHSFPSVHTNTDTDVIPPYGLSLQKPSSLWPPPSHEMTRHVHASLRSRIRKTLKVDPTATFTSQSQYSLFPTTPTNTKMPVDVGATASLPAVDSQDNQTIHLVTGTGEKLTIDQQLHMYTQNSLLNHPLISPCLSYLGGLPPLLIIASDKEVLRDEIIYTAHKAAYPDRFPVKDDIRHLYAPLKDIESKHTPTSVHLQVYDDTAHIVPVLFAFTTPGKFCFRAIASFVKHVTGMTETLQTDNSWDDSFSITSPPATPTRSLSASDGIRTPSSQTYTASPLTSTPSEMAEEETTPVLNPSPRTGRNMLIGRRQSFVTSVSGTMSTLRRRRTHSRLPPAKETQTKPSHSDREDSSSSDVGGPRFSRRHSTPLVDPTERLAGNHIVYTEGFESGVWDGTMLRERVSTKGVVRPLEPESELDGMKVPPEVIGHISELAIRRFIEGREKFEKKFSHSIKAVEKHRHTNLERAHKDLIRNMSVLQQTLEQEDQKETAKGIKQGLIPSSGSWAWAWALDGDETPPPSSIVSRRDTQEARQLAKIADQGVFEGDRTMSANNLWSVIINFLTVTPDSKTDKGGHSKDKSRPPRAPERKKSIFGKLKPTSPHKTDPIPAVPQAGTT